MKLLTRTLAVITALITVAIAPASLAQDWGPRSLDELKAEILHRSREEGWRDVKYEDAERAVSELTSLDRDHWAAIWSGIGDDYMSRATMLESTSPEKARENYLSAFRAYNTGRWPTEKHSLGKRQAYENGLKPSTTLDACLIRRSRLCGFHSRVRRSLVILDYQSA